MPCGVDWSLDLTVLAGHDSQFISPSASEALVNSVMEKQTVPKLMRS